MTRARLETEALIRAAARAVDPRAFAGPKGADRRPPLCPSPASPESAAAALVVAAGRTSEAKSSGALEASVAAAAGDSNFVPEAGGAAAELTVATSPNGSFDGSPADAMGSWQAHAAAMRSAVR